MKIRDGYDRFLKNAYPEHAKRFEQLRAGQQPETLFVTCSDSRIDPSLITQTLPGELFVIRNAGNLVPTRQASGVTATLEYGVKALGVKHIVVCGHSHCGAVAAALAPESLADLPYVAAWLEESGPQVSGLEGSGDELLNAAVEKNVLIQLENLRNLPFIVDAVNSGKLELHGWVYKFESGEIREYSPESGRFQALETLTSRV